MRKTLIAIAALVVLATGSSALAKVAGVQITSSGFNPQTQTVQAGDSVTWTNSDSVNHGVDVNGAPCKLLLAPSQSGSCTFPTAGTFSYSDTESPSHTGTTRPDASSCRWGCTST